MTYEHINPDRDASAKSIRSVPPHVVVGGLLAVLALIFIFQNTDRGKVDFLWWTIDAPTWLWLLVDFVVGVIVGCLLPWLRRRRRT